MKKIVLLIFWSLSLVTSAQNPRFFIHIVSHNEPNENLQQPLNYALAKNKLLQMADLVISKNARWNLQTSDGLVYGARQDEMNTGTNIFETLSSPPYSGYLETDPRNKNLPGRNIADQWYLLDSLGANPSRTVGGFVYATCAPVPSSAIDWWPYTDTVTGIYYGNKVKFNLLSGAGSLAPHCNDLNDFGIFKPDTVTNFYDHNPDRNIWCIGTGCAPLLDSMSNGNDIFNLLKGQADSIYQGLWPTDKFYVSRIMTNQREFGPLFFQKLGALIDSLNSLPAGMFQWATISQTFDAFVDWQNATGFAYSQWLCGHTITDDRNFERGEQVIFPNPVKNTLNVHLNYSGEFNTLKIVDATGRVVLSHIPAASSIRTDVSNLAPGLYFLMADEPHQTVLKWIKE